MKTRLRYQSERVTGSKLPAKSFMKTRLRYQSERVTGSKLPAKSFMKTRLRYQSERVAGSKLQAKSYEDTFTLPERGCRHDYVTGASVSLGAITGEEL